MLAGIRSLLQKSQWRTMLFVVFTLVFYYTRTRPPDLIYDMQIVSDFAFLAMGKTGVAIVDLTDPQQPTELTLYDTYGQAKALDVAGDLIYVADGTDGLKILSLASLRATNTLTQTASISTLGQALDVAVKGDNAFVAARNEGVIVYKTEKKGEKLTQLNQQAVDGRTEHIVIAGQQAYVSNHKNQLFIFDVSNPKDFNLEGKFDVPVDINDYVVDSNTKRVYIATKDQGLLILDVSDFQNLKIIKSVPQVKEAYDVSLRGSIAYVASGKNGFYVLDVSDRSEEPDIPILGQNSFPDDANQIEVVDDYVFVADDRNGLRSFGSPLKFNFQNQGTASSKGNFEAVNVNGKYAYVAAGDAGIRVVNVSEKTAPISVLFTDPVGDYATALDIHNDNMYVTYRSAGLKEYNIAENPEKPILTDVEVAISGEANDVIVKGQYAYVAAGSAGLQIVDLASNIANPQIYAVETPGTAHSVFLFGDYAYVADGGSGFQAIKITDPTKPEPPQTVNTPGDAVSIFVSKQTNSSEVERTYAFVADGSNGLYIVDVSDLNKPVQVATFKTDASVQDVIVQGKTAFLAERNQGLLVLDISTINAPKLKGSQDTPGKAIGLYLGENELAYVADGDRGLRIIDFQDQTKPQEIGFLDVPKRIDVLVTQNPYGYMVDGDKGMWVLDLNDPRSPVPLSNYTTPGQAKNLTVVGSYAYIADGTSGLQVVNISNPQKPVLAGSYKNIQDAKAVVVQSDFAYVISEGQKLYILNVTDPADIKEQKVFSTKGNPLDISISKNFVYLAEGESGLEIVDVEDKKAPTSIKYEVELGLKNARALLTLTDLNLIFVSDWENGIKVFDIAEPASPKYIYSDSLDGGKVTDLTSDSNYIFAAAQDKGIFTYEIYSLSHIAPAGSYEPTPNQADSSNPTIFNAYSISVITEPSNKSRRYIAYVPAGLDGLQIIQADGNAKTTAYKIYETPGEASLWQVMRAVPRIIVGAMIGNLDKIQTKIWVRLAYITYGTILFFVLSIFWLILLAQFVLPVQTINDVYKAARRLSVSLMGKHGPVVYIREGKIVARPDELERAGPGVARVDLNSAIVLEKRVLLQPRYRRYYNRLVRREARKGRQIPRARVEGPGVVFIEAYEGIHGVADLRPQFRLRPGVHAYTRDGIEVENPVWILFTLGQPPLVLDVAYEGERKAENLRVIQLKEADIPAREDIKNLDAKNAHDYQRYQATRRFFQKAKELADSEIVAEEWVPASGGLSSAHEYLNRLRQLAATWDISNVSQVTEFFVETEIEITTTNVGNQADIDQLKITIYALADRLLGETMNDFYENIYQGKKQRGTVVKNLSDELDPDDREEIHRYVQKQTILRFFNNVKTMAGGINYGSDGSDGVRAFIRKIIKLAKSWGIHERDEIQQFIQNIDGLYLEIDPANKTEVRWFAFHVGMLTDEMRNPLASDYYQYLDQELVRRYQEELKDLTLNSRGLSRHARQSMANLCNLEDASDGLRTFSLDALDLWYLVSPEFEKILTRLRVDPDNKVEIDLVETSLTKFDRITQSLVRTDYPFAETYSTIAGLHTCIANLQQVSNQITLHDEWKFPDFLKFYQVRKSVRKIIKQIDELSNLGGPEFTRYADLIELSDFVSYFRKCVNEFRKANGEDQRGRREIGLCVTNVKQKTQALRQLENRSFRRPIRQLIKWGEAINDRDPGYVYFFSKQVEDLWVKIETADQLAIRRYIRKVKRQTDRIQQEIRAFTVQTQSMNGNGEIRQYETLLGQMHAIIQGCPFPQKILVPGSDGGEQIRVGPFQFLRRRVLAAVYSKALDLDREQEDDDYMPWSDLPVHAAAQTFRDLVAKEQYDYLYEPKDAHKFNMPKLKGNFSFRMRNQGVLSFRFIDHINGAPLKPGSEWDNSELIRYEPRELKSPKVLRARGIKVIAAGFPDLFPVSPKIPEQLLETWRAPWISKAIDIRGQHQLQAVRVINQARAQAQRDMAHTLARILQSSHSEEALAMRVFQALESTAVDADTRQFLPRDTMFMLQSFKQWFLPGGDDVQKSMGDIDFYPDQNRPRNEPPLEPQRRGGELQRRSQTDETSDED